jgi:hypothetical protein
MFTNIDRVQLASGMVVVAPWNLDYGQGAVRTSSVLVDVAGEILQSPASTLNNPSCHEVSRCGYYARRATCG